MKSRRGAQPPAMLVLVGLTALSSATRATTDVWLDVDPAIGLHEAEVDDGLALIQAFHSPELHVRGVSIVFGNTTLEKAYPIGVEVTQRFGRPGLEVVRGAASHEDLGKETPAVKAMAEALQRRGMTILALGPVTTVATVVQRHPDLHRRIEAIVMVAARRPGQSFRTGDTSHKPHQDFNFELDPEAMAILLETEIPLVFAPWEVSSQVWIRPADLEALQGQGEGGDWIARSCASWVARWKRELQVDGFHPWDTLGVGWVTHPQLIDSMDVGVWIEEGEDDRAPGSGQTKPYLLVDVERTDLRRATYCFKPHREFTGVLLDRLAVPPKGQ